MSPATTPNPGPYDLGPFQEIVDIKWGEAAAGVGTVSAASLPASLRAYVAGNCSLASSSSAPTGVDELTFNFNNDVEPLRTYTELLNATYTGITSGATWTPNTDMGGLNQLCQSSFGARILQSGASTTVPEGLVYQWLSQGLATEDYLSPGNPHIVGLFANHGRFLSRLPVPGNPGGTNFIDGEQFSVSFP